MNLLLVKEIKNLLQKHNAAPLKQLGQHFLISKKVLDQLIETANLSKKDTIIEIGSGVGTITLELAKYAKKIIAVEKDKKFISLIKHEFGHELSQIELIYDDILKIDLEKSLATYHLTPKTYKVVSNLPYNIATAVIRKFLEAENPPKEMILLLQKEVAQRIVASPPKMSILSVAVQFYAEPKIISYVSKEAFWPVPKVESSILKISRIRTNLAQISRINEKLFFKVVRAGFAGKRKQLINTLSRGLKIDREKIKEILEKSGTDPKRRAETMSIQEWKKLVKELDIKP